MESFIERIHNWLTRHSFVRTAVIFILVFLCAFELDAILRGLRSTYLPDDLSVRYQHGQMIREQDIEQPSEIQPWMTFQYVNFIFKLPPTYLEGSLGIPASQYPNIQIVRYARMHDLPLNAFLQEVQAKVAEHGAQQPLVQTF